MSNAERPLPQPYSLPMNAFAMNLLILPLSAFAFLAITAPGQWLAAAPRPVPSVVTIEGMHCAACAKAVARKLRAVPQVADASVDVNTRQATVTPVQGRDISARGLWEAVEAAGYRPSRIETPAGTFTSKPDR